MMCGQSKNVIITYVLNSPEIHQNYSKVSR